MSHLLLPVLAGGMMIAVLVLFLYERMRGRRRPIRVERTYHENRFFVEEDISEYDAIAPAGLFFRWCARRGMAANAEGSDPLKQSALDSVCRGTMTGSDYLLQYNGGNLASRDLTEEANAFANAYYEDAFWDDLEELAGREPLEFSENEIDYSAVAALINNRFVAWQSERGAPSV